ncbi:MAG: BACON domain-containing carbohydrate-binding protein [Bacteroidales bacterium]|jgi:Leucine-rich repeat (LRR) protein
MKKIVSLLLATTALMFVAGCKPEIPFIEASPTTVTFPQEGGMQAINLSTNSMSWTASVSGKGFSVSPASGAGNASLQLTAAASTSSNDQTGTLTIRSGTMQATVAITQSARNTLIVNGTNTVESSGGTYTLTLQYNTAYTVEIEEASKSWIQYTGTKALSTATLEFLIAPNPGAPRSGQVAVRDNAGIAQTQTFTFEQKQSTVRTILLELYGQLGGSSWAEAKKTNWNTEEPVETWGGVTVEEGKVTQLNLSGFGLTGQLPAAIGSLTDLTRLNIGSNTGLTGPLPSTIGDLVNLDALMAVTTGLEGPLPASMGNLKKLTNLQLNNNNISGRIPEEWGGMEAMKNFGLFNTKISSPLPNTIFEQWKHIGSILLHSNPNLTGSLPPALGSMETDNTLFSVQMHNCNFEGGIPEEWGGIPEVSKQLHLYGNKLTEPVPLSIQNHPSWSEDKWDKWKDAGIHFIRTQQNGIFLDLEQVPDAQRDRLMALYNALDGANWTKGANWNTDEEISTWEGVTVTDEAITGLNLSGFGLKGQLPPEIGELTALKSLNLGNNPNLTGPLPKEMGSLVNLTALMAVTTGLEGSLPKEMGNLNKLTNLQLNNNNISGTIPKEWAGMTALNNFGMFNTKISGPIPDELFTGWKNIATFLMYNNPNLTGSLPEGLGNMTTTQTRFNIHLYECNFTGGIPASWANIPAVSAQLRIYGNKLTEPVPAFIVNHPCWDQWNTYKTNTDIHYIRTQQNGVFLDLEGVLPTISDVTVTELLYNKISVQATVEKQGSDPVTERGFVLNTTTRKTGSGTGTFTADFTQNITENTVYTVKAFATNSAGTVYSPEVTVTTPVYSQLNVSFTDSEGEEIVYADVYLKRISDQTVNPWSSAPDAVPARTALTPSVNNLSQDVLRSAALLMASYLEPYREEIRDNLLMLKAKAHFFPSTRSTSIVRTAESDYDIKTYTDTDGKITIRDIVPGTYGVRMVKGSLVKDFYTILTVPEGVTDKTVENVPLLPSTSRTLALFEPQPGIKPFASPVADDNVIILTQMSSQYVETFAGKNLENIMLFPMDTTSSIMIVANSIEQLGDIYETFLAITNQEGDPDPDMDPTLYTDFIEHLSRRIILVQNVIPGQTNLISQDIHNIKRDFIEILKTSEYWSLLQGFGITEYYNVQLGQGEELILNMIVQQQESTPVLMTDGEGPAQAGGNFVTLSSDESVTNISQLGYNGNWHLGITVK